MATTLRVAELDFDLIKENLKEFLRAKPEFTDYEFDGSALSVLIDLLAYNTHYNAVIGNMLLQELYLDTAVKKQSLALIAKRLGYLPQSYRAPKAIVTLEVFPYDRPDVLTLGRNAKFSTRITSTENAFFSTRDAVSVNRTVDGRYVFENLEIYEGDATTFRYVVENASAQKFEIPSKLVDTTLIRVYVQDSISGTLVEEWKNFNSLIDVTATTKAFFIKLNENLNYEIYFGDDVIGKSVTSGNVVIIDYVTTNGPIANSASSFSFNDDVNGYSVNTVTTVAAAFGGALPESNDSIRRNAQNNVLLQNRAVTESDYIAIINQILPVETIAVYGGETMSPPVYGKVFMSIKQRGTTSPLSNSQKQDIISEIKKRSVLSISHEFIDPSYTYLLIDSSVKYDPTRTSMGSDGLKVALLSGIRQYGIENLNKFNSTFEYSDLVSYIDNIDKSIMSNDTNIQLRKYEKIVYNTNSSYVFNFDSSIKPSNSKEQTITSNSFRIVDYPDTDLYVQDVDGIIQFYQVLFNQKIVVVDAAGTVDYSTGKIVINMTAYTSNSTNLRIDVVPVNRTVLPSRNNILTLSESDISLKVFSK